MENREILEYYMNDDNGGNLVWKCVNYQFARLKENESWKMQFREDFYHDLIIYLLTYDNEKLNNAHDNGHFNALVTRIIQNQIYSSSSKFYIQYLKFDLHSSDLNWAVDEDTVDDEL